MRLATTHLPVLALLGLLGLAACQSRPGTMTVVGSRVSGSDLAGRMDTSDWLERQGGEVWRVMEARTVNGETRPSKHIGYLEARDYRQGRGGPTLRLYEVTSLDRKEILGRIDSLGRVTRYEPVRNGTFQEIPVTPAGRLEDDVGAIFASLQVISLEATSERRIAFARIDKDGNGVLTQDELLGMGTVISDADANGDKQVDYAEFDKIDRL